MNAEKWTPERILDSKVGDLIKRLEERDDLFERLADAERILRLVARAGRHEDSICPHCHAACYVSRYPEETHGT